MTRLLGLLAQTAMCTGIGLFLLSFWQGASSAAHLQVAVVEGMLASLFWLLSAALPFYIHRVRAIPALLESLNAVAAGATGGALIATIPGAWTVVLTAGNHLSS